MINSTWIKAGDDRHRNGKTSSEAKPATEMCLPLLKTGVSRISIRESKKNSNGGYNPVAAALNVTEHMQETSTAGSYHDYVHFNYGSIEQRYYGPSGHHE